MADRPVRYIIEGDASKLKGEFKELAAAAKALNRDVSSIKRALSGQAPEFKSEQQQLKEQVKTQDLKLRLRQQEIRARDQELKQLSQQIRQERLLQQQEKLRASDAKKAIQEQNSLLAQQKRIQDAIARVTAVRIRQQQQNSAIRSAQIIGGVPDFSFFGRSFAQAARKQEAANQKFLNQVRATANVGNLGITALPGTVAFALERQRLGLGEKPNLRPQPKPPPADPLAGLTSSARTQSRLDALVGKTAKVAKNTGDIGKGADNAARAFDRFGRRSNGVLANTARRIKDVVSALIIFDTLRALRDGIRNTFSFIIEANQKVEDARIGIASTLTVAGEFVDQFGKALPIAEQIRISLAEADALIPKLLEISAGRGLNFDALLQTQTATAGFTRAAGFTPDETVETIAAVAFFGEKIGVSQSRIIKTLDNIIKGYRVQQTELGTALGLDSKRVEEMRKQGTLAKGLLELLKGTAEAQKQNLETLTGVKNALEAQKTILAQSVASGFFASVEKSYKTVLEAITEINASPESLRNIKGAFDEIGKDIESITRSLAETATTLAGQDLAGAYKEIKDTLSQGLVDGSVGWLLAGILQFGGVLPAGRVVKAASAGAAVVAGQSGVGPSDFFNFGSSAFDLASGFNTSSSDLASGLAALRAMRESGSAIRAQGGGGSLDDLIQTLVIGRAPSGTGRSGTFRARPQPDSETGTGSGGRVRERTLEQAVNERAEFIKREEDSIRAQLEALERSDEVRLSSASSRLDIAQSELAIIEASERPLNEQLAAQRGIFDLKLAQLDLEERLTAERIRAIQADIGNTTGQMEFELKSEIFELEKRLNDLATERIVLTNENTAAIERQIRAQSDSATILGDIIKGLRDGVSFDDLLGDIGRRSADKFIDNFLTQKLNVLDPAIEGNFLDVIPKALTQGGAEGISGLGRLFSGASGEAFKTPGGTFANIPGGVGNAGGGGGGAGVAAAGGGFAGLGAGLGSVVSGAATGAGFASFGGFFGASAKEQKIASVGGAGGGAIGSAIGLALGGPLGAMVGSAIGGAVGTLGGFIAEALGISKRPKSSKVIRGLAREALADAGLPSNLDNRAGALPVDSDSLPAIARFLSLDEVGQERKLGRGAFDIQRAQQDVAFLLGTPLLGLSQRDRDAAISRVLQSASGGLDAGLDRLTTRRTERLANIQDRARRARGTSQSFTVRGVSVNRTSIRVGNERIPLDTAGIEDYVATQTAAANANFRNEVASLIDGIDDIPAAINGATLALSVIGTDGVAHIERLKDMIEDTASILETGFTGAIQKIAEGSSLRDAIATLEEAYSDTLTERFTTRFLEESIASPKFTEAVAKGNEAIDAFLAGDTGTARSLLQESRILANEANLDSAEFLAGASPFLRELNQDFGGQGIIAPLGGASNEVVDLLSQINENIAQGRSVSVYAQTGSSTTISAREISDAERHAHQRQSSGQRRPDPTVGMRQ